MQDRSLQLFDAPVAPNEHAGSQVVTVWCSLSVYAVTEAALPVRGFPMENAILMQVLFPAIRLAPAGRRQKAVSVP